MSEDPKVTAMTMVMVIVSIYWLRTLCQAWLEDKCLFALIHFTLSVCVLLECGSYESC